VRLTVRQLKRLIKETLLTELTPDVIQDPQTGGETAKMIGKATPDIGQLIKIPSFSDLIKTLDSYALKDPNVKGMLAWSPRDISWEVLTYWIPQTTQTLSVTLYSSKNVTITLLLRKNKNLYLKIDLDVPLSNIKIKYNIKDLLFKHLTTSGYSNWVDDVHSQIFDHKLKQKMDKFAAEGEFENQERDVKEQLDKELKNSETQSQIISGVSQIFNEVKREIKRHPAIIWGQGAVNMMMKLNVPGDWQSDWELKSAEKLNNIIATEMEKSGLASEMGKGLEPLDKALENIHAQVRDELRKKLPSWRRRRKKSES